MRMKKNLFPVLFVLFSVPHALFSQHAFSTANDTLALVDSSPITAEDVFERISLMPFEEKINDRDFESVKRKAVESLVGERLLSLAMENKLDTVEWRMKWVTNVLQKMFVRDAMYKQEIQRKAVPSKPEIERALREFSVQKRVMAFRSTEREAAEQFAAGWKKVIRSKERNAAFIRRFAFRFDTITVSLGSAEPYLEIAAYGAERNTIVGPIQTRLYGFVVFTVVDDKPNPEAAQLSLADRQKKAEQMLTERKELILATEFVDKLLGGQQMSVDSVLFREMVQQFWQLVSSDTISRKVPAGFRFLLSDVYRMTTDHRSQLDSSIIRGSFGSISLGEFLEGLFYYDFTFPSLKKRLFASSFFIMLRSAAESEMIAQEGLRRGYQYSNDVRRDLSQWLDYWKASYEEFSVVDTVAFREWEPYWSLWRNNTAFAEKALQFKVQEILVNDSVMAAGLSRNIAYGAPMDSLARVFSMRKEWKKDGGVSDWIAFSDFPELWSLATMMPLDGMCSMVRLKEGFSVVKLLGRRNIADPGEYDLLMNREQTRVRILHQQSVINTYVAGQAMRHNIKIFYDRIGSAPLENITMATRRNIGFGGRMNAAPLLTPQWEWVEQWKREQQRTP